MSAPPPPIDLTVVAPPTIGDDRLPKPLVVAPPLPRRRPVETRLEPVSELQRPESRPPTAVFELVARYEAGRRRAAQTEVADDSDEH